MNTRKRGADWELAALRHLASAGLKPVRRNFHCRLGEIDLVMQDEETLVFVEVRYRVGPSHGGAAQSVTRAKQLKLANAAGIFLNRHPRFARGPCRFDVVCIDGDGDRPKVQWFRHAFEAPLHG